MRHRAFYLRLPRETLRAAISRQAAPPTSPTAQETETTPGQSAKFVGVSGLGVSRELLCRARSGNGVRLPAASAKVEDIGEDGLRGRPAAGAATADGERLTTAEGQ